MSTVFEDVEKFMVACGHVPPETPTSTPSELANLYKKLIAEEVKEFWDAEAISDDVEQLDGCFDMIWVIVGYMKSRGWDCDKAWEEGASSNLAKIDPTTGSVIRRADGKIMKPEGWKTPNFTQFVNA